MHVQLTTEAVLENEPQAERPKPIRARALILGFLLAFPVLYASINQPVSAMFSLMAPPVGVLIILILLNIPLRKISEKRLAFTQADLLMIFCITTVAAACGTEWAWITHSVIHAMPLVAENNDILREYHMKHLPDWLAIKDPALVSDLPGGGKDFWYVLQKLPVFLPAYLGWGALLFSVVFGLLCVNSLMRGAWTRSERLAFPIIQLPVAMTEKGGAGAMFKSKHMWIAFAIMFGIDMLNGFSYLYPSLPRIPVKELIDIRSLFKEPPLSNMGSFPIAIFPFMAALGVFVPSNLLFSCVLFFLLRKATHVALASYGIPQDTFSGTALSPGPPYFDEQTWGGVIALFISAMWMSRSYLRTVWRDILTGVRDPDGGVQHRWAFVGLIASYCVVVWYGVKGGMPIPYMILYFTLLIIFSVVLTRIRAQVGAPTHEFAFFGPNAFMFRFFGTNWLTEQQTVTVGQVFAGYNRIHRAHPMPFQLEAMKIGSELKLNQRTIFVALSCAIAVGFLLGYFFLHVDAYRKGNVYPGTTGESYVRTIVGSRHGPDMMGIIMTLFGFTMVVVMDALRFRFPTFPLHPAGYVLSMNFGVDYYWSGLLLALIVKNFVTRYYGMRGYDKLRSVALGILLGEYSAETIWLITALITRQSTYTISFNDRGLGQQ